jgi:hypothetical protein
MDRAGVLFRKGGSGRIVSVPRQTNKTWGRAALDPSDPADASR